MGDYLFSLSVIIPNYNKAKYLRRCIESILSQTLLPDEIIIVDDCSTDDSVEIIKELAKENDIIRPIFLTANGGVSNARNTGAKNATTQYISYIDSDDYYYADYKLEKEMNLIKKYKAEGKDIVAYSAMVIVDEDENPLYIPVLKKAWFLNGDIFCQFVSRIKTETIPRDYIVSKEVFERAGAYSYPKNLYEDLDLLFRLSKEVPFYCTLGYGTAYVKTAGGLSDAKKEEHEATIKDIVDTYKNDFTKSDCAKSGYYKVFWKIERIFLRALRKIYTGI